MLRAGRNLVLAAGLAFGAVQPLSAGPQTLVALGDSLTQGYGLPPEDGFVPQLARWLKDRGADVVVVNAGVSGDTTAGALARAEWAMVPETDALIVTLGGNDLLRGLPPAETRANLDAILAKADTRRIPVLLVEMRAPGNYGPDYKAAFDAIYPDLARAHGALLAPEFLAPLRAALDAGTPQDRLLQPDGLHPTAEGVALVVDALGPKVQELLEKTRPAGG